MENKALAMSVLSARINARNKRVKSLTEAGEPEIGIFWWHDEKVMGAFGLPVQEGMKNDNFITSPLEHRQIWESLKRNNLYNGITQDLKYDELDRGKVAYNTIEEKYFICLYLKISNGEILEKISSEIVKAFKIPAGKWKIVSEIG